MRTPPEGATIHEEEPRGRLPETPVAVDLHVHTVASGHAFSTVVEIAREAAARGLHAVGLADHGPALPGGPHLHHFRALGFLPRTLEGVGILRGVEANLLDAEGAIDIPGEVAGRLDYVMVGFHPGCGFTPDTSRSNTRALINAMGNPRVKAITHPGNPAFPVEVPDLVAAAADRGVALELNNASLGDVPHRRGSHHTCVRIAEEVARRGGSVCLSSDAHFASAVGAVDAAWEVAAAAGLTDTQVVNRTRSGCLRFLGIEEAELNSERI